MRDENAPTVETQWARVRGKLRAEFGEVAYRSWLKPLTLAGVDEGEVRIAVPTRFMQDWVRTHYAERLRALWKAENKLVRNVEVVVAAPVTTVRSTLNDRPPSERMGVDRMSADRGTGDRPGVPRMDGFRARATAPLATRA